jgi:hypothetical protein
VSKPGEKFPGLDAIRARAARPASEKKRGGKAPRPYTAEELAALPPSVRKRVLARSTPTMTTDGVVHVGRPSKLTEELIAEVVKGMVSGAPVQIVAGAHGVNRDTCNEWLRHGQHPEYAGTLEQKFAVAVARARDEALYGMAARVRTGSRGWQGSAWLLERLERDTFKPPTSRQEISGPGGGSIQITPMTCTLPAEVGADGRVLELAATSVAAGVNGLGLVQGDALPSGEPEAAREGAPSNGADHGSLGDRKATASNGGLTGFAYTNGHGTNGTSAYTAPEHPLCPSCGLPIEERPLHLVDGVAHHLGGCPDPPTSNEE